MANNIQKYYTRIIGIYFLLIILTLIIDFYNNSHRPETWHKLFHILLGIIIIKFGWSNKNFWKPFSIFNGLLFLFAAAFGFTFPSFANELGLEAFSISDTYLHAIVGILGIVVYFSDAISSTRKAYKH